MIRVIDYRDPVEGCTGHLVYDGDGCALAAGGFRMRSGVTEQMLRGLASRMTLKQRVLGSNVDGAKCGIDYDPAGPAREAVLTRFVTFLRDELATRYSMGCDMGTRFDELEQVAAGIGLPSVKYAVQRAQRLSDNDFRSRMAVLKAPVGRRTVGQRRAGHALAHAVLAAADHAGHRVTRLRCGIQGFGNLGRSAAESLVQAGAWVTAVADEYGCAADPRGIDVTELLKHGDRPVAASVAPQARLPREALFELPVDVLVLAAVEDAVSLSQAAALPAPIVVVGANRGVSDAAEQVLASRGVLVIPDFVGGVGGSASMEVLFGAPSTPEPHEVLDNLAFLIRELCGDVLASARQRDLTPSQVASDMAAAAVISPQGRPYGASPYARPSRRPKGNRFAAATARMNRAGGKA
ncbi:Glu/Leu/Phe/Val dehydrogenase dimerization domain-containing protein [Kibdelosporangium aridum]|uniref:Glu/Leu/Phe/Val dehydrogenase dimerization domain-containing protein n=1 Tax=Kibdelosporangium aridum TaxID=2030 RepID=UPI0035E9DB87